MSAAVPVSTRDLAAIRRVVRRHSGNVLEEGKDYLVTLRLQGLARRLNIQVEEVVDRVTRHGDSEMEFHVADAMTINETSFFRDGRPFTALRDVVFPELLERGGRSRTVTVWSAACSSGQEPYSVAILLREHFGEQLAAGWRVRLIASDLSPTMLARVEEGWFSAGEVARGLSPQQLHRWFVPDGDGWRVRPELRTGLEIRQQNLLAPLTAVPVCDVVLLRNVLIYFDVEDKRGVLGRVHDVLRPGGALFLGGAESTLHLDRRFARRDHLGAVHYVREGERPRDGLARTA